MSLDSIQPLVRFVADRYAIEGEIGRGGMATVYLARDLRHNRNVALKVLDPELGAVLGAARFLSEIQVTANLHHPNLLPLFDSGDAGGLLFYVMPYVEGETLRHRINREKQLPVDEAIRIATAIANALEYAHGHGVIHRDLKPENILLQHGQPVVADFGIALAVSNAGGARVTQTGLSLGTPQYMSPEQATGDRSIDGRTDIYSLAAVLYEMLTGEPPHTGTTAQAIVAKLMTEDARPLTVLRRSVPLHVDAAVRHALEKLPADRFATAREFAAALQDRTTTFSVPGVPARARANHRWIFAMAGLVAGGLIAWFAMRSSTRATPGEPQFYAVTLPESTPFVAARESFGENLTSIAVSHDGRSIAYNTATPAGSRLMLIDLDAGQTRPIPASDNGRQPVFSPNGRSVAFVVSDSILRRVSLDDGTITPLAKSDDPLVLVWLDDDRVYGTDFCPWSAPATGGARTPIPGITCRSAWATTALGPVGRRTDKFFVADEDGLRTLHLKTGVFKTLRDPSDTAKETRVLHGGSPMLVASRYLTFMRDSTLFAALYDADADRLLSSPRPVLSGIRAEASGVAQIALSDDATLVWAAGGFEGLSRIVRASIDGRVLDTLPIPPDVVGSFVLSRDGSRIAMSRVGLDGEMELVIADIERRLVNTVRFPDKLSPAAWANHDHDVILRRNRRDGATTRAVLHVAGSSLVVDTIARFASDSPDGRLACRGTFGLRTDFRQARERSAGDTGDTTVVVWKTSGSADSVDYRARGSWCRFSPDSRFVAWANDGSLFVGSTDPKLGGAHVQIATDGCDEPRWSADGRTVYYRNGTRWFAVPAPSPDLKPAGVARVLFQGLYLQAHSSWDLTPDGKFLLLSGEPARHTTHFNVLTHFDEFLRRKLEPRGAR